MNRWVWLRFGTLMRNLIIVLVADIADHYHAFVYAGSSNGKAETLVITLKYGSLLAD